MKLTNAVPPTHRYDTILLADQSSKSSKFWEIYYGKCDLWIVFRNDDARCKIFTLWQILSPPQPTGLTTFFFSFWKFYELNPRRYYDFNSTLRLRKNKTTSKLKWNIFPIKEFIAKCRKTARQKQQIGEENGTAHTTFDAYLKIIVLSLDCLKLMRFSGL